MSGVHGNANSDGHDRRHDDGREGIPVRPDRSRSSPHDRRRLRVSWWILAGSGIGGLAAMGVVAAIGGSGRAGLAVLLLLGAAGSVLAALVTAALAMVDEYRRIPAGRIRAIVAASLFLGAGLLLMMSVGVAGG